MAMIKYFATAFLVLSNALMAFADTLVHADSVVTITSDTTIVEQHSKLAAVGITMQNVLIILVALYEVVVRLYPTIKNYSLLSWVYKVLSLVLPNAKRNGGKHD